ncbi:short-chain dehydrogenase/reductase SDR [Rhodopirellula maiorica SM1]|uniref:Short-chain dehydrogenase/reductase SDR n=1 Tax=Rhodopirellula maiorica SM1 TaxID=1265738 RepID=M5RRH4_9BACT|nr:SDR family NAD(P)-dependent oxidoreductase [Rhodopirellula maiorica]EMI21885.1 short-chain dehydrogenase/reductase SDR [Rhodopirellula maiorica SM1]
MQIENACVLVTGGSSGLGAACVARLAKQKANIVIADLIEPAESVLREFADQIVFARTDVCSEADMRAAIELGQQRYGSLRGVVACAGVLHAERLLPRQGVASLEAFRRVIDVNLVGTFNTLRLCGEAIASGEPDVEGERGVMVMTSSVTAFEGQIGQAAYAASKGAVASLALPLAREMAQHAIRVVAIAPGVFETPMMQAAPDKVRQSLIDQTVFPQRLGQPAEFAALVLHILENAMINGATLRLDGGVRLAAR